MDKEKGKKAAESNLHPRNIHRGGYDMAGLVKTVPGLEKFLTVSPAGQKTIDFSNPTAVYLLNVALLKHHYGLRFYGLPQGYLCPPVPGRADYLHHLADLLAGAGPIPKGRQVRILDIGTGANCIYPILGHQMYGWSFVGTDVDEPALLAADEILGENGLRPFVELRFQKRNVLILNGAIPPTERFDACMCNPPFHASAEEAREANQRKVRNLGGKTGSGPQKNFGGQSHELWYPGGEVEFLREMAYQSSRAPRMCKWFTALVSQSQTLPILEHKLRKVGADEVRIIPMATGNKATRIVAWRFERD